MGILSKYKIGNQEYDSLGKMLTSEHKDLSSNLENHIKCQE